MRSLTRSGASLAVVVGGLLAGTAGCMGGALDGTSLTATDQALFDEAATLVFSFSSDAKCADLVNADPKGIGDQLQGAPLQLVDLEREPSDSYTFGKVPPNEDIAYLVLLSSRSKTELGDHAQFSSLKGSVFAIGCRDFNAASGTRHDLPITVFPSGLR
jgi:hypothetical protein